MRRLSASLLIAFGLVASGALAAQAEPTTQPPEPKQFCAFLFDKSPEKGAESPLLAGGCSDNSPEDARERMNADARAKGAISASASVTSSDLLMTWFDDIDYGGSSANIYGAYGPCDSAGYELRPSTTWPWSWGNTLSSAAGTTQCDMADFISQSNTYARTFTLPVPWLGQTLNDNVGLIRVWND